jgi:hypothetical protein
MLANASVTKYWCMPEKHKEFTCVTSFNHQPNGEYLIRYRKKVRLSEAKKFACRSHS